MFHHTSVLCTRYQAVFDGEFIEDAFVKIFSYLCSFGRVSMPIRVSAYAILETAASSPT